MPPVTCDVNGVDKGTGWKEDLNEFVDAVEKESKVSLSDRFGAAPRLPKAANVLAKHVRTRDQKTTSSCVAFAFIGAILARLRLLGFDPEQLSERALYTMTLMLMRAGRPDMPLIDDGSYPFLALMAMLRYGLLPEKMLPFSEKNIVDEIDFAIFQNASQFRIANFKRIDVFRRKYCMTALAHGHPVPLGMRIGSEFNKYRKGRGPVGIEEGPGTGRHMTFLIGYRDGGNVFVGQNSWGSDYGENGTYEIDVSKLEHESTTDLMDFVITDSPAPANDAHFQAMMAMVGNATMVG